MAAYEFDDPAIEKLARRLEDLVCENGGHLDESLIIRCRNGSFSVGSKTPGEKKTTASIKLPESCLIPVEGVEFGADGDDIIIKSCPDDMSALRRELMDTMLALLNATGKLKTYREQAVWYKFADRPDILDKLLEGREAGKVKSFREKARTENPDDLLAQNCLDTRILSTLLNPGATARTLVIMPIIDFFNHHPRTPSFQMNYNKEESAHLTIFPVCAVEGSDECFVSYGRYDAYDTYMVYNFVDRYAPFVRSVPQDITLPMGTIRILGQSGTVFHKKLHKQIADLHAFLPAVTKAGDGYVEAGYLLIPSGSSPFALRRVLGYLINVLTQTDKTRIGLGEQQMKSFIRDAEAQILERNRQFYQDMHNFFYPLSQDAQTSESVAPIIEMITVQKEKLAAYPLWDKTLLRAAM